MSTARSIDVQELINTHPVSRFQGMVMALCFLVVAIDGFDTAAIGFIAPALRAQWSVTPAQLARSSAPGCSASWSAPSSSGR